MAGEPLTLAVAGPLIVSHCDAVRVAALQDVGVAYVLETYAAPFTDTGRLVSLLSEFLPPFGGSSAISNTSASRPPREPSSTLLWDLNHANLVRTNGRPRGSRSGVLTTVRGAYRSGSSASEEPV